MNHFHRVIFNRALGVRQVVSEIANSGRGAGTQASTGSTFRAPRLSLLAAACVLAWSGLPDAQAATCDAGTSAELVACISGAGTGDLVRLTADITLGANLSAIHLAGPGDTLTINGNGHTLNGAATYRGFFIGAGNVTVNNLAMTNMLAKGGDGGTDFIPGGGGMGAGGAVFVATGATANLNDVTITSNQATGGNGGGAVTGLNTGMGGGGGMGGNGGGAVPGTGRAGRGGGGLFDAGGVTFGIGGEGGAGGGPNGGAGDMFSGAGGDGGDYSGGGGGSTVPNAVGGNGGLGGGGGGANTSGGDGGFGGGGGGSSASGGAGGFGGGGGGAFSGDPVGAGGFGGGNGGSGSAGSANMGGGGGAAMGGGIFVMAGGSLNLGGSTNTQLSGNGVTGGTAGGTAAGAGAAFGTGIFLQGSTAQLTFAQTSGTQTIADVIADQTGSAGFGGSIGITKTGAGTTILSGNNLYTGGTTIANGTLQVGGGGTTGAITGNVANNSTLNYARNTSYTILTSTGATTGAFTGVTSNLAFLTPSLSYLPNGVTLNLLADTAPVYSTVAQTPNQTSIANYLNSFASAPGNPAAAALIQQIDNLSADQARVAFDSMSGSPHAAASQVALAMGRSFSATLAMHTGSTVFTGLSNSGSSTAGLKAIKLASVSSSLMTRPGDVVSDSPLRLAAADPSAESQDRPSLQSAGGLWGQAMGTGGRIGSDGSGPASRYRANGFVFGYDQPISSNWLAGAALAYNKAQWDASTNGAAPASGSVSSPQAGLYARYASGPWQLRLDGTYSDHRFSTDRTVTIGNASSIARSSHGGTEWAFAAQAEYSLPAGDWEVRPLAGLRHARLSEDGFTETGAGAASLTVDARKSQNTVASLGMKFIRPLNPGNTDKGALELRAVASHLMGDNNTPITSRLAGQASSFTTVGTPLKRTALTLGGTLTGQLSRGLSVYADAAYEFRGAGQNAFQFVAGLKLAW